MSIEKQRERLVANFPEVPVLAKHEPSNQSQFVGPASTGLYMFELGMIERIEHTEGSGTITVHIKPVFFELQLGLGSRRE